MAQNENKSELQTNTLELRLDQAENGPASPETPPFHPILLPTAPHLFLLGRFPLIIHFTQMPG